MKRACCSLLALAIMLLWLQPAAAEGRPAYGGRVVGSLLSAPVSIDPLEVSSQAELSLVKEVFDTLYKSMPSGRISPHLATAIPDVSADGLEVRISIRPDVHFHDGSRLLATDVVASLRRLMRSPRAWLVAAIKTVDDVDGVVVMKLRRRAPELIEALCAVETSVTPKGRAPNFSSPVGSGPFRLVSHDRAQRRVVLEAYDAHHAGRPYLDSLVLRWFENASEEARDYEVGKSQLSQRGSVAFAGQGPKYESNQLESLNSFMVYLGFGDGHGGALRSRALRQVITSALDLSSLTSIGSGEAVNSIGELLPTSWGGVVGVASAGTNDIEKAKQLWRTIDAKTSTLVMSAPLEVIVDRSRPDDKEIAEKILAALYRLGIKGKLTVLAPDLFIARVASARCDLFVGQLIAPYASAPWLAAAALAVAGGGPVVTLLRNTSLDKAPLKRRIREQRPLVPLFHRTIQVHYRGDLYGVRFDQAPSLSYEDVFVYGKPARNASPSQ